MPRLPFDYDEMGPWCGGPEVDLDLSAGFPICDEYAFTSPTAGYATPCVPPELGPQQFCPCIPTIAPSEDCTMDVGHTSVGAFDIKIVPDSFDCCEPDFRMTFDMDIPCLPFSMIAEVTSKAVTGNVPKMSIIKEPGTCKFKFQLAFPPGGGRGLDVELYQHGGGVQFLNCCSGTGIVDMDATMLIATNGNVKLKLFHHVDIRIPLLAKLVTYVSSECWDLGLEMTDPWGDPCEWVPNGDTYVKKSHPGSV